MKYTRMIDEKVKNMVALNATLLSMNEKAGADRLDAVLNANYVIYAYLEGQTKQQLIRTISSQAIPLPLSLSNHKKTAGKIPAVTLRHLPITDFPRFPGIYDPKYPGNPETAVLHPR